MQQKATGMKAALNQSCSYRSFRSHRGKKCFLLQKVLTPHTESTRDHLRRYNNNKHYKDIQVRNITSETPVPSLTSASEKEHETKARV